MSEPTDALDETAASDTIKTHPSRTATIASVVDNISKMTQPELVDFCAKMAPLWSTGTPVGDNSDRNKHSLDMKPSDASPSTQGVGVSEMVQAVREDLDTVLAGQDLPPEAVEKLLTLFEAAVQSRVAAERARIEDEHEGVLAEQADELVEKIDGYLEYAAQEFFTENEVAIENSLKIDLYEEFIEGLGELFRKHYVQIPEDALDVTAALADRVAELEEQLNAKTQDVIDLEDRALATAAQTVFAKIAEGMTDVDRAKLQTLSETVEFDGDEGALAKRLETIREAHFAGKKKPAAAGVLAEGEVVTVEVEGGPAPVTEVSPYADAISRMAKRKL